MKDFNEIDETSILLVKDLQKLFHIGRDKAYSLMRTKGFPSTKMGKTYFVTTNALEDWLKKSEGRIINM